MASGEGSRGRALGAWTREASTVAIVLLLGLPCVGAAPAPEPPVLIVQVEFYQYMVEARPSVDAAVIVEFTGLVTVDAPRMMRSLTILNASSRWQAEVTPSTVNLTGPDAATVLVRVLVPAGAPPWLWDDVVVNATCTAPGMQEAHGSDQVGIDVMDYDVIVMRWGEGGIDVLPGGTTAAELVILNGATERLTIQLEAIDSGGNVVVVLEDPVIELGHDEARNVTVHVSASEIAPTALFEPVIWFKLYDSSGTFVQGESHKLAVHVGAPGAGPVGTPEAWTTLVVLATCIGLAAYMVARTLRRRRAADGQP